MSKPLNITPTGEFSLRELNERPEPSISTAESSSEPMPAPTPAPPEVELQAGMQEKDDREEQERRRRIQQLADLKRREMYEVERLRQRKRDERINLVLGILALIFLSISVAGLFLISPEYGRLGVIGATGGILIWMIVRRRF